MRVNHRRAIGFRTAVTIVTSVVLLAFAGTAQARLVDSVAVTPQIETTVTPSAPQATPDSQVPIAISLTNSGADLDITGQLGFNGTLFTTSAIRSWFAVIEYLPAGGTWTPLAGIEGIASGYNPAQRASIASGLTSNVTPQSRFGVTYPATGDRVVGTSVSNLASAAWNMQLGTSQSAARIQQLLDSGQTSQIRLRTRIEALQTGLFGIQYIVNQTGSATFTQMLRSQSGSARDVNVTLDTSTGIETFSPSVNSALTDIAPGSMVDFTARVEMPALAPKQVDESDADYLNRLRAVTASFVDVDTTGSFIATGAATPWWWWIGENDPGYDLGPSRSIPLSGPARAVGVAAPIMEIDKSGPATIDAGDDAEYSIQVANTGDAEGVATVTDLVDGQPPATVPGIDAIPATVQRSDTHTFHVPIDFAGSDLHDRATVTWSDGVNTFGPVSADFTSTVIRDTEPPQAPALTQAPAELTPEATATFSFTGEPGGTFRCSIDGAPAQDCSSPVQFAELEDGEHTFSVWQVDDASNVGSATTYVWTVDTTAPEAPSLSGVPESPTNQATAVLNFNGESGGAFECAIDQPGFASCASPVVLEALTDGLHEFHVRQIDAAGNTGTATTGVWTVDTDPPVAPILHSTPLTLTRETSAGFGFTGEAGGRFECRLDGAEYEVCENPVSYEDLSDGPHNFDVRQIDAAGNAGAVASFGWTIDHEAPPAPSLVTVPSSLTAQSQATFEFEGEVGSVFECAVDSGEFSVCDSPFETGALSDGSHSFSVRQRDEAGNVGDVASHAWTIDASAPDPPTINSAPASPSTESDASITFSGETGATFECRLDDGEFAACESPQAYSSLTQGQHTFAVRQADAAGNVSGPAEIVWSVELYDPPDDLSEADMTPVHEQVDFLWAGDNPIQDGVAPGTIQPTKAAMLRGHVSNPHDVPVAGVTVTVDDHPEYGQTVTDGEGNFAMAVNGGSPLTVRYEKDGYLEVLRRVEPEWLDFEVADEAVLTPVDEVATTVDSSGSYPGAQVVEASTVTDADGSRKALMVIPPYTQAVRELPDGTTQPLAQATIRQTEYTVGPKGEEAMPAPLPGSSAYTYAMSITVDGLTAEESSQVTFSRPVNSYVKGVVDIPTGSAVPVGTLDYGSGTWSRSTNGRAMRILGFSGGMAELDIDGSGTPATEEELLLLGIGGADRGAMGAAGFQGGDPIWQVPTTRAGGVDYNMMKNVDGSYGDDPEDGANDPDCNKEEDGSIIECESQNLREELPLDGTPYRLTYTSGRTAGRTASNSVTFRVTGNTVPPTLRRVLVQVNVAGRRIEDVVPAEPNQTYTFTWDGKDAFGREMVGTVPIDFGTGFVYPTRLIPTDEESAFGRFPVGPEFQGVELTNGRREAVLWRGVRRFVGTWRAKNQGVGGWTIDAHHRYDPISRTLYTGDGKQSTAENVSGVVSTTAGNCLGCPPGTPRTPATTWGYLAGNVLALTTATDGSIYLVDRNSGANYEYLTLVRPDGSRERVQHRGGPIVDNADVRLLIHGIEDVAAGPDGSVYFIGRNNITGLSRLGVVHPGGTMRWIQPDWGTRHIADDVNLSELAPFVEGEARGLDVGQDGSIYLVTQYRDTEPQSKSRVWRILPTGEIDTVAGTGPDGETTDDEGFSRNLQLSFPEDVAVANDGSFYVSDRINKRLLLVSSDGVASRIGWTREDVFPGAFPNAMSLAPDGTLYFEMSGQIWRLGRDNEMVSMTPQVISQSGDPGPGVQNGDGGPYAKAFWGFNRAVSVGPDGRIHIASGAQVRSIIPPLPGFTDGEIVVPDPGGEAIYVFDRTGRHLRTQDAKTNATLLSFAYDSRGLLSAITDADANTTTIARDPIGKPVSINGPFGRSTQLLVDNRGDLRRLARPSGREYLMNYSTTGLLAAFATPNGGVSEFTYDPTGRLLRDDDRGDGFTALARTDTPPGSLASGEKGGFEVQLSTSSGPASTHTVSKRKGAVGDEIHRTVTERDGRSSTTVAKSDSSSTFISSLGLSGSSQQLGDPRFGMRAPRTSSSTVSTAGGRTASMTNSRSVEIGASGNLLDLATQTDTSTINGRTSTDLWQKVTGFAIPAPSGIDAGQQPNPTGRHTSTTPAGRTTKTEEDAVGRPLRIQTAPGLEPVAITYDAHGLPAQMAQGARTWSLTRNAQADITSETDPLGRQTSYQYDADGRMTRVTLPGGREALFEYDEDGNLSTVTPPSRPPHNFTYDLRDLATAYQAPQVGAQNNTTQFTYDDDQRLTGVTRADGQEVDLSIDAQGRVEQVQEPGAITTFSYDSNGALTSATSTDGTTIDLATDGPLPTSQIFSGEVNGTVSQDYDADLRLSSTTAAGSTANYTYDADSLMTQAGALSIARDAQTGLPTQSTLGTLTTTNTFDSYGELAREHTTNGASTLLDLNYSRDQLGRIQSRTEVTPHGTTAWSYLYDTQGHLAQVDKDGQPQATYTYDQQGNRLAHTDQQGTTTYATYDDQDRLTTYGDQSFTYNAAGEMTARTQGQDTTTYDYNAFGNLVSADLPDGTQIEYELDPFARRIAKVKDGQVQYRYLYGPDAITPVAQLDARGDLAARFVYGTSSHVPEYIVKGQDTYRLVTDQLGSVRLAVDASTGAVVQEIAYDAFGNITHDSNPGFQPFYFAGGLYDQDTGLIHFGEREYDPGLGRFTSVDPIGFASGQLNLHAYVMNDPVNVIDPTGLDWVNDLGQAGMCFGDSVTFGVSAKVREWMGNGDVKQECSDACKAGELGAAALPWPGGKLKLVDRVLDGARYGKRGRPFLPDAYYHNTRRAPTVSAPYGRHEIYNPDGSLKQVTTYDRHGRRTRQYDVGPGTRHGEGSHEFTYNEQYPLGKRGDHETW